MTSKQIINLAIFLVFTFTLTYVVCESFQRMSFRATSNVEYSLLKTRRHVVSNFTDTRCMYMSCFYVICGHVPLQLHITEHGYVETF